MPETPYEEAKRLAEALGVKDQLRLIAHIAAQLRSELGGRPQRSLLELRGLGKEVWKDVDAPGYVDRERSSWDE